MPEVSRFLGIVISMYAESPARHHEPHFHAYYGEHAAVFSIASGQLLAGSLPTPQARIVEAWRRARLAELQENWERLQARQQVNKIPPLLGSMAHKIYRVESFKIVGPYTLRVEFDDNTQQVINFWPALWGDLYEPLRDPTLFKQVQISPEVHTLVWPNGADFDPETLHEWDKVGNTMAEPGAQPVVSSGAKQAR